MLKKARTPGFWIIIVTGLVLFGVGWLLYETASKVVGGAIAAVGFGMGLGYPLAVLRWDGFVGDDGGDGEGDGGDAGAGAEAGAAGGDGG